MADDLNEVIEETIDDASVITVPIDDTLSNSGEAADAKAVGDALALKADKSEIQTSITVNGQSADAQGSIIVTAADTQISGTDQTTVKAAIEAVDGKTAEDIPVSSSSSQTIKQALDSGATRTADQIPMSGTDSTTVKTHIDSLTGSVSDLNDAVSTLASKTAADILYNTGSTETIKQHIETMEAGTVKTVNEISPDADGNIQIERVAYADNLYSEDQENVTDSFLIRTTAGSGSLSDGNAWAQVIRGNRTHPDFVPESLQMTVNAMPRPTPPAITATLNEATFEAYVEEAGTYTVSYDGTAWDTDPTLYGLTISNTPVDGDVITMVWDGENDAVVSITAGPRTAPPAITATIDRDTFVSYVTQSGTTTLTYTTAWSADPEDYGITVTNDPIAGDQIIVVYVKEVRGTITVGHPTALVATGWNLYNHTAGYARVVRYSDTYGYLIQGTYTALKFAETPTGTQTTITPDASGLFQVPSDGYVIVTGGNNTNTAIICTWSDWTGGPSVSWEAYSESGVSLSSIMTADFPYGLCKIVQGTVEVVDEIDFVHKEAISRITRLEYTAENLATVIAAGRPYEYDENYIYQERASYVVTSISVDEEYQVSEHGLEWFADSTIELYSEILYGTNLKDKLKRDVVTISEQTLTSGQQSQVRTNIGAGSAADVSSNSSAIAKVQNGLADTVGNTNTTGATLAVGQFVYVKGHSTIAEGLRKVTASISANGNITTNNTSPVSEGGLNALNSKITSQRQSATINTNYLSEGNITVYDLGNLVFIQLADVKFKVDLATSSENNNIELITLPIQVSSVHIVFTLTPMNPNDNIVRLRTQYGKITPWWSQIKISQGEGYCGSVVINKA